MKVPEGVGDPNELRASLQLRFLHRDEDDCRRFRKLGRLFQLRGRGSSATIRLGDLVVSFISPLGGSMHCHIGFASILVCVSACEPVAGELTTNLGGELPQNGKLVEFGRPPLNVVFTRNDRRQALNHTPIGGGSMLEDVAFVIELNGAALGETIPIQANCAAGCFDLGDVTIVFPEDTAPPELEPGPLALSARAHRSPFSPLVSAYELSITTPPIIDDNEVFFHIESDEFEVLRQSTGNGTSFQVDGGLQRRVCLTITLVDSAGNESLIGDNECVALQAF